MMKKLLKIGIMYVFAMLLTCFVLIGCALDKTPPDDDGTDTAPEAFTVTLNKNELTLEEGKTESISYVLSAQTDNIAFTSDNEGVVTVGRLTGEVTAVSAGNAKNTLSVEYEDVIYKAECKVTVTPRDLSQMPVTYSVSSADGVTAVTDKADYKNGETVKLTVTPQAGYVFVGAAVGATEYAAEDFTLQDGSYVLEFECVSEVETVPVSLRAFKLAQSIGTATGSVSEMNNDTAVVKQVYEYDGYECDKEVMTVKMGYYGNLVHEGELSGEEDSDFTTSGLTRLNFGIEVNTGSAYFNIQILFNKESGAKIIKSLALGNNSGQNIENLTEVVQLLGEGEFTFVIVREGENFSVKYTDGKGNLQDFVTDFTLDKAGTIKKVNLVFWCIGSDVSVTGGTIVRGSTDYAALLDKAVPEVTNADEEKFTVTGLKENYAFGESGTFTVSTEEAVFDVLFNGVPVAADGAEGNSYTYSFTAGTKADITVRGAAVKVQPVGTTGLGVSSNGYVSALSVEREVIAVRIAFDKLLYEFDEETQTEIVPDNTEYFQYSIGFTVNGVTHSIDMFRNTTAHNFVFKEYVKTDTNTNENNSTKTMSDKLAFAKALNAGSVYVVIVRGGAVYSSYYSLDGVTLSPMFTDLNCLNGNDGFVSSLFMRNKNSNGGGKTSVLDGVVVRGSTDYTAAFAMIKV